MQTVLAIVALWPIAVAKPILDVVGASPEYWAANRIDGFSIVIVALLLSILAPLIVAGIIALLRIGPHTRKLRFFLFGIIFVTLLTIALYHTFSTAMGKPMTLVVGCLVASIIVFQLYLRFDAARLFFSIFSTAALLVPLSFLILGPTYSLLKISDSVQETVESAVKLTAPLVVVLFDEVSLASLLNPEGEIDEELFPNFSRLAGTSTWFRNATTNYGSSERSVPSFLTGKFQDSEVADSSFQQNPINLFTLVEASDGVFAIEAVTNLCPPDICAYRAEGLIIKLRQVFNDFYLIYQNVMVPDRYASRIDPIPTRFHDLASINTERSNENNLGLIDISDIGARLLRWFGNGKQESLVFLHFLFPHAPYMRNSDGSFYTDDNDYKMPGWIPKQHLWDKGEQFYVAQAFQRYLLQLMYADKILGEILESLEEMELFSKSTIVVSSDHGVAFKPGEQRRSNRLSLAVKGEIIAIPLIWKSSGQNVGIKDDRNIELIDFLPTILDDLGGDVTGMNFDGDSAFSENERAVKIFHGVQYSSNLWQDIRLARDRLFGQIRVLKNADGSFFPQPSIYSELIGINIHDAASSNAIVVFEDTLGIGDPISNADNQVIVSNYLKGWINTDSHIDAVGIAVNGVIVDVADIYFDKSNQPGFISVLNPIILNQSGIMLDYVAVRYDSSGNASLALLRTETQSFHIMDGNIVDGVGNSLKKNQKRLAGALDTIVDGNGEGVLIRGWMGDRSTWTPPIAYILVYKLEQQLSWPSVLRPDLGKISKEMVHGGFSKTFRLRGEKFDLNQLRIIVIFDNETYAEMEVREGMQ